MNAERRVQEQKLQSCSTKPEIRRATQAEETRATQRALTSRRKPKQTKKVEEAVVRPKEEPIEMSRRRRQRDDEQDEMDDENLFDNPDETVENEEDRMPEVTLSALTHDPTGMERMFQEFFKQI